MFDNPWISARCMQEPCATPQVDDRRNDRSIYWMHSVSTLEAIYLILYLQCPGCHICVLGPHATLTRTTCVEKSIMVYGNLMDCHVQPPDV